MLQFNSQINNGENNNVSGNICPCENCNQTRGTKMIRRTTSNISFWSTGLSETLHIGDIDIILN